MEPSTISRTQIDALAAHPGAWTLESIRDALASCDYEQAARCALARVRAGTACPIELVVDILIGIRAPSVALALIAIASGDRADALLAATAGRRFPLGPEPREIEVIALFAAAQLGARREALIPEVRRLARARLQLPGYVLLGEIAATLADPNVDLVARHVVAIRARLGSEIVDVARADLTRSADEVFASLPAQVEAPRVVSGFTVRTGPRPGRNDACPCGSGQKYKRCCADKDATFAPSPIAGLSWDDYVATAADRMTADDIGVLSLRDLARVDATRLDRLPLLRALHRFSAERAWPHVARLLEALARLPADERGSVDDFRDEAIGDALEAGARDFARDQLARMAPGYDAGSYRLELDLAERAPGSLDRLLAHADEAIRDDARGRDIDLAFALLRGAPALGILVARGCLRADRSLDSRTLLDVIEEVRDERNLVPGDRAWDVLAAIDGSDAPREDDDDRAEAAAPDEAREAKRALRIATTRLEQLEAELAAHQAELAKRRDELPAPAATPSPRSVPGPDAARTRALAMKVEELQGLVREGNAERRELRNQLAAHATNPTRDAPRAKATETTETTETTGTTVNDDAKSWTEAIEPNRRFSIPRLDRRAITAVREVPASVAAEAMRTLGSLCAGDSSAWRAVKQARDMGRRLFMARIGIHHRLLFQAGDGDLEVLDLVPREALDTTLKRLRMA